MTCVKMCTTLDTCTLSYSVTFDIFTIYLYNISRSTCTPSRLPCTEKVTFVVTHVPRGACPHALANAYFDIDIEGAAQYCLCLGQAALWCSLQQ